MLKLYEYLNVGQNAVVVKTVTRDDSADTYPNEIKDVLATPRLLHWAIDASIEAIDPYLPKEYASIGKEINFAHISPSCVGMTVTIKTTIVSLLDNEVIIDIRAWDERDVIAKGTLKRGIIKKEVAVQRFKERSRFKRNPARAAILNAIHYK